MTEIDEKQELRGNISIKGTIVASSMTEKGDVGPQGKEGKQGKQGEPGQPNILKIGTVEKGDEAKAEIVGDSPNQILNLILPKGDKGNAFTYDDFTEEQLLALTGPEGKEGKEGKQGKQGEPGQQGEPGPANVLTIGTVENGEKANATITGTSPSQKLNLTLPKGTDGISITKVEQTQISDEDSGINTIEISLSNGTSSTFEIKNGSKGSTGSNGATFTPNIDDEGNLSWSNDKNLPNPDTKNIKGEKGDTLVEKHYNTTLTENLTTTELEIPASYKVGTNCLQVYFEGDLLEKDIHYEEIGEPNSISNKIKIDWLTNWKEETGEEELIFSFIVQGTEEESV